MGGDAIGNVTMHYLCHRCFPNRGHNFPLSLAIISQMVKNRNTFSKVKMAANTMCNFGYLAFLNPCMNCVSKSQYPY